MSDPEDRVLKLIEAEFSKSNSNSILLSVRSGDGRLRFEGAVGEGAPDSGRSHYSETNYQLLGALIEVVTERSLADALAERIFTPLEMTDTYLYDYKTPPAVEPLPFFCENTRLSLPLAMTSERGTGGCVSTMATVAGFCMPI